MSDVQSVVFSKKYFTISKAESWLKKHGYKTSFYGKGVDETSGSYRYRQQAPSRYKKFISKRIDKGIVLVIGFPK